MTAPRGLRRVIAIAAVVSVSVLAATGASSSASGTRTAFGWGNNATGELAVGTTVEHKSPVAMIGLGDVTTMSAGTVHGLALETGGSVLAWGHNRSGQVGDGSHVDRLTPVAVAGLSNVTAVAAGNAFSLAVRADGAVYSWGNNASGQLGDGSAPTDHATPVPVTGLGAGSGVVAVAGGGSHSLALKSDGSVLAWGNNASGQLGDGSAPADKATPVPAAGLGPGSGVVKIAAGAAFSLALKSDGTVLAWGNNASGQLGDGSAPADHATPVPVSGLGPGSGVVKIAAGGADSFALRSNGSVLAWGNNAKGEIGNGGAPADAYTPVTVSALPPIVDIAAGDMHGLALAADGSVFAWGDNVLGQLGDGTTTHRISPVRVAGLGAGSNVVAVFAGGTHSHALTGVPVAPPSGGPPTTGPPSGSPPPGSGPTGGGPSANGNAGNLPRSPGAHPVVGNPAVTG